MIYWNQNIYRIKYFTSNSVTHRIPKVEQSLAWWRLGTFYHENVPFLWSSHWRLSLRISSLASSSASLFAPLLFHISANKICQVLENIKEAIKSDTSNYWIPCTYRWGGYRGNLGPDRSIDAERIWWLQQPLRHGLAASSRRPCL